MNITWEKLVLWALAIILLLVIIGFLVAKLGPGDGNIVKLLLGSGKQATEQGFNP